MHANTMHADNPTALTATSMTLPGAQQPSGMFLDTEELHQKNLDSEISNLLRHAALLMFAVHASIAILCLVFGQFAVTAINSVAAIIAVSFYWRIRRAPANFAQALMGVTASVASMAVFVFIYPGPGVIALYVLSPAPVLRLLGLKWGMRLSGVILAVACTSLFADPTSASIMDPALRINMMIAFVVATGFAWILERSRQDSQHQLTVSLAKLKVLRGIVSICAQCKYVKIGPDTWHQLEALLHSEGVTNFSHALCPDCYENAVKDLPKTATDRPAS